jgi:steroid 5-alpha reductase family enzyme
MDTFQFRVLPVGSLIALIAIAWLVARIRQPDGVRDAVWATASGIVGGALLVAVLV